MLNFEKLVIVPAGHVAGGYAQFSYDSDSGNLSYQVHAELKFWVVPYNVDDSGVIYIDPKKLLSSSILVGESVEMGPVTVGVVEVKDSKAVCNIIVNNQDINEAGTAVLDLSKEFIQIDSINLNGTVKGFDIALKADVQP